MTVYIDMYDALKEFKSDEWGTPDERLWPENKVAAYLVAIPAADVRPIIKAHWDDVYMTGPCSWAGTCSHCGRANDIPPPSHAHYCPNCGAEMKEGEG